MATARHRRGTKPCDDAIQGGDDGGHRSVTDDVEARGDSGFGARAEMGFDGVDVEIAVATAVGVIGVGLVQPGGSRTEGSVDEQIAGQPAGTGELHELASSFGGADGLPPVTDDLDAVVQRAHRLPVVDSADVGPGTLVHRDDARAGGQFQRLGARQIALRGGQQLAGHGPDQVVGLRRQRKVSGVAVGRGQARDQRSHGGAGGRGVHVDAGEVGEPAPEHLVQLGGGGRGRVRPLRFIPAVAPDRTVRILGRVLGQQSEQVCQGSRRPQVEPDDGQPGCGEVDVAVHEGRGDERALEIDQPGVRKLAASDVVGAQPHHRRVRPVGDRDCGRLRHDGRVHPAIDQQRGQVRWSARNGRREAAEPPRRRCTPSRPAPHRRCSHAGRGGRPPSR